MLDNKGSAPGLPMILANIEAVIGPLFGQDAMEGR